MKFENKSAKGTKRAWCKKKLRQLLNVFTNGNSARFEATPKTLQLNKTSIFCSTVLLAIIGSVQSAWAMTPVIMIGNNASDTAAKVEKAYSLLSQVAFTASKFSSTKEGRTAVLWLLGSGVVKGLKVYHLVASPAYAKAAIAIALFCSSAYGLETIIGSDTFIGADLLNMANKWCVKGYGFLGTTAILPKDAIGLAIKFLEGMKSLG